MPPLFGNQPQPYDGGEDSPIEGPKGPAGPRRQFGPRTGDQQAPSMLDSSSVPSTGGGGAANYLTPWNKTFDSSQYSTGGGGYTPMKSFNYGDFNPGSFNAAQFNAPSAFKWGSGNFKGSRFSRPINSKPPPRGS